MSFEFEREDEELLRKIEKGGGGRYGIVLQAHLMAEKLTDTILALDDVVDVERVLAHIYICGYAQGMEEKEE